MTMMRRLRTTTVATLPLTVGLVAPPAAAAGYDVDSVPSLQIVVNKHRKLDLETCTPKRFGRMQSEQPSRARRPAFR
ncbi:hypothetical protein [Kocuria sp. U4B]